jgi:uncharacterized protein
VAVNFTEHALSFACAGEELLGIVTAPEQPEPIGVIIVVGGPQYRVGSHRQFLLLARALARAGYPAMRFDYRGMGDSTGELRDFDEVNEDIGAAINAFQTHCPQVERIVLWGLCDAASAILLYWDMIKYARVGGLILLNPWVRSEATLARTHIKHYYGQRLFQAEFWHKLISGNLGVGRALQGFVASWRHARKTSGDASADAIPPFQIRMMRALEKYPGPVLLILSSGDYTAKEFLEACQGDARAQRALAGQRLARVDVAAADHTFSSREWRQTVEAATLAWLQKSMAP